jgi:hypothetical protein
MEPPVPCQINLCRAGTRFFNHFGRDDVLVYWYRRNRDAVYSPYEKIVSNYDSLSRQERRLAKNYVDQLLTEDEVSALHHYLASMSGSERILAKEVVALLLVVDFSAILTALDDRQGVVDPGPDERGCGHVYLYHAPDYRLPFRIVGSYRHPILSPYAIAASTPRAATRVGV